MRNAIFAAGLLAVAIVPALGCGSDDSFPMADVSGTVTYEDGSLIPGDRVVVNFIPQVEPLNPKTHPRNGYAVLDKSTGAFDVVTTSRYGDGLIRGKHKVFIVAVDEKERQLPVIPAPYNSPHDTPLLIDTGDSPLKITIPRRASR